MNTFRLKQIMHIAKVIRDSPMHLDCKSSLVHKLHLLFYEDNPLYDSKKFIGISKSIVNDKEMDLFLKQRKINL